MDSYDILVIILSVTLAIFLVLAIVATISMIKLISSVRRIAAKGEQVIDTAEQAAETFAKAAGPISFIKAVSNIVDTVHKHKHSK